MTTIPITTLCVTHRGPHAATAEPGLHVCHHCLTRLLDTLTDLPRLWTQLAELELTSRDGVSGRAGRNSTPPARLDVIALLDPRSGPDPDLPPAAGIIRDWARLVSDQRHYRPTCTVTDHIDLLIRNTTWLAADPDLIAAFTTEITVVRHTLRRICGETATVIGQCREPHPDPQHDGPCGGPLVHTADSDHPVRCTSCGDTYSRGAIELAAEQLDLATWLAAQ